MPPQGADLVIGSDLVVTGSKNTLSFIKPGHTKLVVNSYELITGEFTQNADMLFPSLKIKQSIQETAGNENAEFLDASRLATALIGDTIATNIFLIGYAYQRGLIPLEHSSIEQAIQINGVSVDSNIKAFLWGRSAHNDRRVREIIASYSKKVVSRKKFWTLWIKKYSIVLIFLRLTRIKPMHIDTFRL